ncbi:uncharacterized protein [Coffea arabica]|uniref:Uncharacterized protein n=1 Tax=Coffea arabica TaxID=13443 RepID=A0A6P6VLC4_COFAR
MLCSISASTSTATSSSSSGRSNSNWLEKLRSSKGFPSSTDLDLEQFLALPQNHNHPVPPDNLEPSKHPQTHHPTDQLLQNPTQQNPFFTIVTNVLAELFCMGDSSLKIQPGKKCSRKQTIPKFCLPSDPPSDFSNNTANYGGISDNAPAPSKTDSASPVSDDNSGVGLGKELADHQQVKLVENVICIEEGEVEEEEEEEEMGYGNLSGFSRTEVTVIDTSFASWKFDKMLFRKKNVWKVRDKRGQFMSSGKKKKRKASSVDSENVRGGLHRVKKPKTFNGQRGLSKKGSDGAFKDEYHLNDKSRTASRKISDSFSKALKKKQSTLSLENGGSSVVLIKNIPTGKKSGTSSPRSCPKSIQRQVKV